MGDQLDDPSSAFTDFDSARDPVVIAEVRDDSTCVWSAKPRTAFFVRRDAPLCGGAWRETDHCRLPKHRYA
jgi:deoxyribodipyrimidine photolyase-related protein